MNTFQKLLSEHIGLSLVKQQALGSFLGEHSWSLNLEKGVVDFGEDRIFPIQFIGTESEKTWLWGWANSQSNISQSLLIEANHLRAYGNENQINFLSSAEIPLSELTSHEFGMLASGFCNADGYYHGSHDGGAVLFLVYETSLPKIPTLLPQQIVLTIASALQSFDIEHRMMVSSFLKQLGSDVDESERLIEGKLADGTKLMVGFDDVGRIVGIEIQPT
jgi:hypothetical protein